MNRAELISQAQAKSDGIHGAEAEAALVTMIEEYEVLQTETRLLFQLLLHVLSYAIEEGAPYPAIHNRVAACIPEEYK